MFLLLRANIFNSWSDGKNNFEMRKEYWKKYYIFFKKDYAKYNQIHYRMNKKKILYNRRIYLMKNDNKSFDREHKSIILSFD